MSRNETSLKVEHACFNCKHTKITVVYIGVTSELRTRILQHREHYFKGSFTDKYNCTICVYYENFSRIEEAIAREKELKKWNRTKKNELITLFNAQWINLWTEIEKW